MALSSSSASSPVPSAVKFLPFSSTVDSPFWVQYCRLKLEKIRLNEDPIVIRASYGDYTNINHNVGEEGSVSALLSKANRLQCQESSLGNEEFTVPSNRIACQGTMIGYNTLEAFQRVDKNALLKTHFSAQFFASDEKTSFDSLSSFVLLTFADLKQHKVLYWFGFPTFLTKSPILATTIPTENVSSVLKSVSWTKIANDFQKLRQEKNKTLPYFLVTTHSQNDSSRNLTPLSLSCLQSLKPWEEDAVFGFVDPTAVSYNESPSEIVPLMGWPMRNLVAYLVLRLGLGGKTVTILSLRPGPILRLKVPSTVNEGQPFVSPKDVQALAEHSVLLRVKLPNVADYDYNDMVSADEGQQITIQDPLYKVVGWELNSRQKPGPRWVNLRPLLDQNHLAIQASDLNLKLMKWRMIPSLDVEMLQSTKVLLLGAGTLGCSVARTLLGWGVRNFKFVDYGNVSYSNPVRQNLFTLDDCHFNHGQGRPKAQAAAEALKSIAADATSEGIFLSIPMPGHAAEAISAKCETNAASSLEATVQQLDELVQETDVIFLLTDTRESRWLPTVMAAAHDKILINAALGLDSWLVMRHGGGKEDGARADSRLGCYFCNDVVAPENSTKNRTLDQQCTVTRPGLAPIASSMAVELLISMLHHSKRLKAPAPTPTSQQKSYSPAGDGVDTESSSALGVIPHQIRGSLISYTMMTPTVPAFQCCTGCSFPVIESYNHDKFELVSKACASMDGSFLDNLSGLASFRAKAAEKLAEIEEDWGDDE